MPSAPTRELLQAVLFDMDGTLVDTEELWLQAVTAEAELLGLALGPADQPHILGRAIEDTAAHLIQRQSAEGSAAPCPPDRLCAALEQRFATMVGADVVPLPGALALLDALGAAGVTTALVSASPRRVVDMVLAALGGHRFAVSFAAGETAATKPAPDPYLAAAAALGVPTAHCVAVEDTPTGIASAEAAGCAVLAVPSATAIEARPGRLVVDSLLQVDLALLYELARSRAV